MPPPSRVFDTLLALARSGALAAHVGSTLPHVALGFALGSGVGSLAAAAVGTLPLLRVLFDLTAQALRAIPSITWVPLFILWLDIFEASKVALIAGEVLAHRLMNVCFAPPTFEIRRSALHPNLPLGRYRPESTQTGHTKQRWRCP